GHAVAELRRRKNREEKPLAIMVENLAQARALCEIDSGEEALLTSSRRPIVLLRKKPGGPLADQIAPGNPRLGVMLPYTPLHHLLMRELNGMALVMTSGNRSDEPIVCDDAEAVESLGSICDVILT